jgi:dihydrofolate reductase
VDELYLHVAPLVLGAGRPLFEPGGPSFGVEKLSAIESPLASHQRYLLRRG